MDSKTPYFVAALGSFIIWGFISFCLHPLHLYNSADILFFRIFFSAGIISLVTFALRSKNFKEQAGIFKNLSSQQKKQTVVLTVLGGILLTANWFFYIYVMNQISIKAASFAYLICPIITAILASLILKEKLKLIQWIAVALSMVSCVMLGTTSFIELLFSLIVALSYAFYLISQKRNSHIEKFVILTFQMLSSAILLLPFFPVFSTQIPTEISFYLLIVILAVVFTIIPLLLNLIALKRIDSATMGILLYINPLLNFSIAFFYFHEKANSAQFTAYSILLLSIVLFNWNTFSKKGLAKKPN
ncbi:MAG: EamA family transporter [Bacteroidia bacterium]|nr:EamA family transporter [Bacteroidia bacterium]